MIEEALAATRGRVSGPSGPAARLRMPPSTLESKIRALRIAKDPFQELLIPERRAAVAHAEVSARAGTSAPVSRSSAPPWRSHHGGDRDRDHHPVHAGRLGGVGRRISCDVVLLAVSFYLLKQDLVRAVQPVTRTS
jgi:hypothetical protein